MILFCPKGHLQNGLPAMGGLCEICIKDHPEEFECKDGNCSDKGKGQHFHPDERSYFVDENGKRVG
jgi:hypothetical protein